MGRRGLNGSEKVEKKRFAADGERGLGKPHKKSPDKAFGWVRRGDVRRGRVG